MNVDQNRSIIIGGVIILCGLILIARLFYLQVLSDTYAQKSDRISKRIVTEYPDRGLITDRHGELLVFNADAYDLTVNMPRYSKDLDTAAFCQLLQIDTKRFVELMKKAKKSAYNGKAVFLKNLSIPEFARIQKERRAGAVDNQGIQFARILLE